MGDRIGQQLGNYRLTSLLGQGGFAEVYLGEHVYLKTPAAIKVLHNRLTGSEELTMFLDEARMVAHLTHPHIVRVLDFGVDDETPFLVMDYAPGGTLRQRHQRGERLPVTTIARYVRQMADALQYAHDEKVIHRDIKPENMLVGAHQEIVLSDFGIALVAQSSRYQSTQEVIGTVAYMAPEQIQGKPRLASDQYSLGITVYEWLCGERPFSGSFTEVCSQHLFAPVPPLREKVPTLSPEIERVVTLALAKEPKERFGSVQAFATALEAASQATSPPLDDPASPEPVHFSSPWQVEAAPSPLPPTIPATPLPPTIPATPLPPTIPATPSPLSPTIPVTSAARVPDTPPELAPLPSHKPPAKGSRQKKRWMLETVLIAVAVVLFAGIGLTDFLNWYNGTQIAAHEAVLTTAYQPIVRHQPDVEYTLQDHFSQQNWKLSSDSQSNDSCTFVAQGYLVGSLEGDDTECIAPNGLPHSRTRNLLVQVTMSIQSGTCGTLAVNSNLFEGEICKDGTMLACNNTSCNSVPISAIHQGLDKDNILALAVVVGQNNQTSLITFINGQCVSEKTIYQNVQFDSEAVLYLGTGTFDESNSSILYKDVKVWQVSNPVS